MSDQQQTLHIGVIIGHYRIVRHISSGGFGKTYEVEHVSLPLRRCIKEFFMHGINQRVGDTVTVSVAENRPIFEQMRTKFLKEAQRMAQFHNPHVVPVTDFFEQNGTAYYVMELIEGKSLAKTMGEQQRPFSEQEVREMLPQILSALGGVHAKGIFHLDLKPGNILRDDDGHLWLIDFGASKQISVDESQTLSNSTGLCYTPHYAPSELIQGSTKHIGPWTDLYSLGATLYNLLTRKTPPEIADIEEEGAAVFAFPSAVSDDMRQLILWLMQPRRSDRPQSVADVEQQGVVNVSDVIANDNSIVTVASSTMVNHLKVQTKAKKEHRNSVFRGVVHILLRPILIFVLYCGLLFLTNRCDNKKNINGNTNNISLQETSTSVVGDSYYLTCPDSNHPHLIDLGLPSGTKWVCCNIGASSPNQCGDYYALGETKPKDVYNWDTYEHRFLLENITMITRKEIPMRKRGRTITSHDLARTYGRIRELESEFSFIVHQWGDNLHIPSFNQYQELIANTKAEWTTMENVHGYEFTSSNGGTIFLPAAGRGDGNNHNYINLFGFYWSKDSINVINRTSHNLFFSAETISINSDSVYYGFSVRQVRD